MRILRRCLAIRIEASKVEIRMSQETVLLLTVIPVNKVMAI